ncbi:MAG: formylglycine-generating enzyme family protein [Thermoguttaceae bacterium]
MKVTDCSTENTQTRITIKSQRGILFECLLVLAILGGLWGMSPCVSAQENKAGERKVLTINGVEYPFRWCPAGAFVMGSPESEGGFAGETERPQHNVTLTRGFWMLETEVTQEMWESMMEYNPSEYEGKRLPVERVHWYDCQGFIQKLNKLVVTSQGMSFKFALPTEAQWEYACRAGTTGAFGGTGNHAEMCYTVEPFVGERGQQEVGKMKPNAWGLYDMHGNVNEWCQDLYDDYKSGNVTDPVVLLSAGSYRVYRGGDWRRRENNAFFCRSAYRGRCESDVAHNDQIGFRIVGEAETEEAANECKAKAERVARERISREALLQAGERKALTINGVEYALRWCPPGAFMMGCPKDEQARYAGLDEPQHHVTLTKGFWMLETEVTQEMWESAMDRNYSEPKGKRLPVNGVGWYSCQDFLQKLNQVTVPFQGMKFALPTEAQWEYACRAGTTGAYGGSGNLDEMGWYRERDDSKSTINEVGKKKPNAWGLYDMHGNMDEWCQDREGDYQSNNVIDPVGPGEGLHERENNASGRVLRGGNCYYNAQQCESTYRVYGSPGSLIGGGVHGFRIALVSE